MKPTIKIGEKQRIYTETCSIDGTVVDIQSIDTDTQKGTLVTYSIDNYGVTNGFYVPDGTVLESQIANRRNRSGMPKEHVYKFANDFKWNLYGENVDTQKRIVNAYVVNFDKWRKQGRGLYIYSKEKGSGKTMLSCCIANEILKRNDISAKFISMPEYIELVKAKTEAEKERKEQILNAALLIVDDIGTVSNEKEWIDNAIFHLVNRRHENLLPTIYTSNIECEKLKCDDRISSRIYEDTTPILMPEISIRKQKADEENRRFIKSILDDMGDDDETVFE